MTRAECPTCGDTGPHRSGMFTANVICACCNAIFADPTVIERRARSAETWHALNRELVRMIDAPNRRHAMRTEYRRRVRTRTRSRR